MYLNFQHFFFLLLFFLRNPEHAIDVISLCQFIQSQIIQFMDINFKTCNEIIQFMLISIRTTF